MPSTSNFIDVATIAFGHTIGVKKLNASHPSLKKA